MEAPPQGQPPPTAPQPVVPSAALQPPPAHPPAEQPRKARRKFVVHGSSSDEQLRELYGKLDKDHAAVWNDAALYISKSVPRPWPQAAKQEALLRYYVQLRDHLREQNEQLQVHNHQLRSLIHAPAVSAAPAPPPVPSPAALAAPAAPVPLQSSAAPRTELQPPTASLPPRIAIPAEDLSRPMWPSQWQSTAPTQPQVPAPGPVHVPAPVPVPVPAPVAAPAPAWQAAPPVAYAFPQPLAAPPSQQLWQPQALPPPQLPLAQPVLTQSVYAPTGAFDTAGMPGSFEHMSTPLPIVTASVQLAPPTQHLPQ